MKHARLLRSGALDHATARDLEVLLDDYQVRTVIDLRTEEERKEPSRPTGRPDGRSVRGCAGAERFHIRRHARGRA